ncbi:MAG TPA: hypothetical protein ENI49_00785 [Thermoplasmatales archaeon]|nr:hypothetical protein [Thermoplasmatales archaeon]
MKDGYLVAGGLIIFALGLISLFSFLYLPSYLSMFLPILGYTGIVLSLAGLILVYSATFRNQRKGKKNPQKNNMMEDDQEINNVDEWDVLDTLESEYIS